MIAMDVDTALSEVPVNLVPLTDDTDFKSLETGVVYNAAGMALYWHFVTSAGAYTVTQVTPTTGGTYDWSHQGQGMYTIEIPASGGASINNDTEGYGWFTGVATGVLPWRGPTITFRAAALNDALIDGGDLLDVNTTHLAGTAQTGRDIGLSVHAVNNSGAELAAASSLPANFDLLAIDGSGRVTVGAILASVIATLAAAIEAAMIDDGDATALLEAIADKIADENVTAEVLGTSIRDAILDRVLSGNHDIAGSTGKLIQEATASTFLNSLFTSGLTISNTTKELFQHLAAMYLDYKRRTDGLSDQEKLDVNAEADTALSDYAPAQAGDAMALTSGERDAVAAALLDLVNAIETGITPRAALRLILAAQAGKVSGAGTGTETFRNAAADSKDRIVATVDGSGNRTALTLDVTD
jgi:hypothetical protein